MKESVLEPGGAFESHADAVAPSANGHAPEIMTIEQVAEYLQLHPQVVYRHVRAGTLPASRIGRTIRFKRSVLNAFLEKDAWSAVGRFLAFVDYSNGATRAAADQTADVPQRIVTPERAEPATRETARRFSVDVD